MGDQDDPGNAFSIASNLYNGDSMAAALGAIPGGLSQAARFFKRLCPKCGSGDDEDSSPLEPAPGAAKGRSQVLSSDSQGSWYTLYGGSHGYAVLSDRLPPGTTPEEANDLLQRFNAPTEQALHGNGNDPNALSAWVADPFSGYAPVGNVSVEHGDGWVTNTTEFVHPFIGTITRGLVENPDGSIQVYTVGHGEGGVLGGIRHEINAEQGPGIFADLDDRMMQQARKEQLDRFTAQDQANRENGYYGAFGDPPTKDAKSGGGEGDGDGDGS
jgi:hypothetical protein